MFCRFRATEAKTVTNVLETCMHTFGFYALRAAGQTPSFAECVGTLWWGIARYRSPIPLVFDWTVVSVFSRRSSVGQVHLGYSTHVCLFREKVPLLSTAATRILQIVVWATAAEASRRAPACTGAAQPTTNPSRPRDIQSVRRAHQIGSLLWSETPIRDRFAHTFRLQDVAELQLRR